MISHAKEVLHTLMCAVKEHSETKGLNLTTTNTKIMDVKGCLEPTTLKYGGGGATMKTYIKGE